MKTRPATTPVRKKKIARAMRSRRTTGPKIATGRRAPVRRKKIEVPSILLEGDQPMASPVSGPGQKYALGPTPLAQHFETAEAELPEAYGTRQL